MTAPTLYFDVLTYLLCLNFTLLIFRKRRSSLMLRLERGIFFFFKYYQPIMMIELLIYYIDFGKTLGSHEGDFPRGVAIKEEKVGDVMRADTRVALTTRRA